MTCCKTQYPVAEFRRRSVIELLRAQPGVAAETTATSSIAMCDRFRGSIRWHPRERCLACLTIHGWVLGSSREVRMIIRSPSPASLIHCKARALGQPRFRSLRRGLIRNCTLACTGRALLLLAMTAVVGAAAADDDSFDWGGT